MFCRYVKFFGVTLRFTTHSFCKIEFLKFSLKWCFSYFMTQVLICLILALCVCLWVYFPFNSLSTINSFKIIFHFLPVFIPISSSFLKSLISFNVGLCVFCWVCWCYKSTVKCIKSNWVEKIEIYLVNYIYTIPSRHGGDWKDRHTGWFGLVKYKIRRRFSSFHIPYPS